MTNPITWLWRAFMRHYNARRRAIDIDILWPTCVAFAQDLDHAKAAFAVHAFHDDAWLELGGHEIARSIDALGREE